jgi:O-antigen/teichoic acid export membrane protein
VTQLNRDGAAPPTTAAAETAPHDPDWRAREIRLAVTNGIKLATSLLATWGIALVVRLYIPRFLGPDRFGVLNFADAFTTTAFVVLGLGLDTYVRREISVRPEHASDFIGGIAALRLVLVALVYAGMELVLRAMHRSAEVRTLVYIYGAAQFFMVGNTTTAGLLQATGKVNEMSMLSVAIKVLWGIGIGLAIFLRLPLWAFAATVAVSEGLKSLVLFALAKKHLGFHIRIYPAATYLVVVASLPFFISGLATAFYDKVGVSLLAYMSSDREVGWYGSAVGLAGLTLLLVPLISWVLIPLFARAAKASEDELCSIVRRSLEFILTLTIPVALIMVADADILIRLAFGSAFAPATLAMRLLGVAHLLMYVSIVCAYALAVLKITWPMSFVFVSGMFVNPTCNLLLIRPSLAYGGPGGGGAACASATLITEIGIVIALLSLLGKRAVDRQLGVHVFKQAGCAVVAGLIDYFALRQLGPVRMVLTGIIYVALVLVTKAADVNGMITWVRTALKQRRAARASAA